MTMRAGQRGTTAGHGSRRFLDGLIVAEVVLAVVLLYCSTLLARSFVALANVDTGFSVGNALTMSLPIRGFPPGSNYSDPEEFKAYVRDVVGSVDAIPGVRNTAITSALPLTDCCLYTLRLQIEGRPALDRASRGGGFIKVVTPSYFSTLGLTLESGRFIDERDASNTRRVIVINERLADQYFPGENPIGQRILSPEIIPGKTERGADVAWEIVGVLKDEKTTASLSDTSAVAYASYEQSPVYFANLVISADLDAELLQRQVRDALRNIDERQAVRNVRTLDEIKSASIGSNRFRTVLLSAFALMALVLAAIGMFGVLAYSVIQRTREIGIRAAIGATRPNLLLMVLRQGAAVSITGLALGLLLAYALSPLLSPILYGVTSHDPYLMAGVSAVFLLVGLAACLAPAVRAARLDPITVLRSE
jgi:putative ABC transport system permease protein